MKWQTVDQYHIKSGLFTISKASTEGLPKPYGLWFQSKLIRHFATSKEAMNEAEMMQAGQI